MKFVKTETTGPVQISSGPVQSSYFAVQSDWTFKHYSGCVISGVVTLLQVVSLPNLRVIDFSYGHTGSSYDSTTWKDTQIVREHEEIIKDGEWIWADSAYPVRNLSIFLTP